MFFSTFEPLSLTPNSFMQRSGIPMVYERAASQLPTLYVCGRQNKPSNIVYDVVCDVIYDIVCDIVYDVVYDIAYDIVYFF